MHLNNVVVLDDTDLSPQKKKGEGTQQDNNTK